jgi:hypothetical protein
MPRNLDQEIEDPNFSVLTFSSSVTQYTSLLPFKLQPFDRIMATGGLDVHQPLDQQSAKRMQLNQVITNYMKQRLSSKGYDWTTGPSELSGNDQRVVSSLITLSNNMMTEFGESICSMTEQAKDIVDYEGFVTIASEVLSSGIQWSHIVTLLVFSTEMAFVQGVRGDDTSYIQSVSEWLTRYFSGNDVSAWIESHGGWDGVVYYGSAVNPEEPPAGAAGSRNLLGIVATSINTIFGFFSRGF